MIPVRFHPDLASGPWFTYSLAFQLANVGSEVGRALKAKAKGCDFRENLALERALELLDLTIGDSRNTKQLSELCRLRECLCDFFVGENEWQSSRDLIDRYFLAFGYEAQMERETTRQQ